MPLLQLSVLREVDGCLVSSSIFLSSLSDAHALGRHERSCSELEDLLRLARFFGSFLLR